MPRPVAPMVLRIGILLAMTLTGAARISAQASQSSPAQAGTADQKQTDQKQDDSQQPTETLKVNVNVVQLFFNVKDKHGALIPNLNKDDFEVAEDGKPQTIKYFT